MAARREIADDIRRQYGNFLSQNQAQAYLGMGSHQTQEFLADVPFVQVARKKRFMAIDIARKLDTLSQTAV